MKRITLEEQKLIELDILIYIDKICSENDIKYSLDGGTLIGALRHKGFIPWDDDIDIMLLRKDYKRLMDILRNDKYYTVYIPGEEENYFYGFTKVIDKRTVSYNSIEAELGFPEMGVFLDIFPYDNIGESFDHTIKKIKKYQKKAVLSNRKGTYYYPDRSLKTYIKRIIQYPGHFLCSWKSPSYWMKMAVREAESLVEEDTKYIGDYFGNLTMRTGKKTVFPRNVFQDHIDVEFERHIFKIIKGYDTYLTAMYGDYMTPPPKEKQVLPHDYEFYWKEDK